MSFVRVKYIKGYPYYYEVENVRIGGKVVQKHIRYIGATGGERRSELVTTQANKVRHYGKHTKLVTTSSRARSLFSMVRGFFKRRGKQ